MSKILFLSAIVLELGFALAQEDGEPDKEHFVLMRGLEAQQEDGEPDKEHFVLMRGLEEKAKESLTLSDYCHQNPTASILYYKQTFSCADLIQQ